MTRMLFVALVTLLPLLGATRGNADINSTERRTFTIMSQSLSGVLAEFGANFGIPISIDDSIRGEVRNMHGDYTPKGFLNALSRENSIDWYYDGTTLHVTPTSAQRSVVVNFAKVSPQELTETLDAIGLADRRFPTRANGDGRIGIITAPPRYVELVENAFALLEARTPASDGPGRRLSPTSSILIVRGDSTQVWRGKNAIDTPPPPLTEDAGPPPDS